MHSHTLVCPGGFGRILCFSRFHSALSSKVAALRSSSVAGCCSQSKWLGDALRDKWEAFVELAPKLAERSKEACQTRVSCMQISMVFGSTFDFSNYCCMTTGPHSFGMFCEGRVVTHSLHQVDHLGSASSQHRLSS